MSVTRGRAIALLSAAAVLPRCSAPHAIRVGSKNFTESIIIAEIYAQALESAGLRVERRFNLGSTQILLAAMMRGEIDVYPEYTGTALIAVLHHAPVESSNEAFDIVRQAFATTYHIEWLTPSPMSNSQALATTQSVATRYHLRTLSDLAHVSRDLRLATIPEFLTRADGLPGLQHRYGGFTFKSVKTYDIALKYQALLAGDADVATAFTTDGAIASDHLVVLTDDKHVWPPYNVAPLVRSAVIATEARIAPALDRASTRITDARAQAMNAAVETGADPAAVAAGFLRNIGR